MPIEENNVDMCELLLDHSADIEAVDLQGFTPLHVAVFSGAAQCTKLLIDRGANVIAKDNANRTPILVASQAGQTECGRIVIAKWREFKLSRPC